jgi:hypothetical protein
MFDCIEDIATPTLQPRLQFTVSSAWPLILNVWCADTVSVKHAAVLTRVWRANAISRPIINDWININRPKLTSVKIMG